MEEPPPPLDEADAADPAAPPLPLCDAAGATVAPCELAACACDATADAVDRTLAPAVAGEVDDCVCLGTGGGRGVSRDALELLSPLRTGVEGAGPACMVRGIERMGAAQ